MNFVVLDVISPDHSIKQCRVKSKNNNQNEPRSRSTRYHENKNEKNKDVKKEKQKWTLLTALATNVNSESWYVDSGATNHMTNKKTGIFNTELLS